MESYYSNEMLDDPRYVKFFVNYAQKVAGKKRKDKALSFHKCTDEDYESFLEIE